MTDWITASGQEAESSSNLATPTMTGPRFEWGTGGVEIIAGHSMTRNAPAEVTSAPTVDPTTGLTFKTKAGFPVPAGGPRYNDLVEIDGMWAEVGNAIRDGLIPDPSQARSHPPAQAHQAAPQVNPAVGQSAAEEAPYDASEDFGTNILPNVSQATMSSLEADLAEGQFSEKTKDYLTLEANLTADEMDNVRDAYAAKVTAATGLDEAELEDLWNNDRASFNAAVNEMLKTGSTSAFQALAEQADAVSYTPMNADEATTVWTHEDFPAALTAAGIKPNFSGPELTIEVPGKGTVLWSDAVRFGYVKVSRYE